MTTEAKIFLEKRMGELKPLLKNMMGATDKWHDSPSILSGARMYDARKAFNDALVKLAEEAMEKWKIPTKDLNDLIDKMEV